MHFIGFAFFFISDGLESASILNIVFKFVSESPSGGVDAKVFHPSFFLVTGPFSDSLGSAGGG